MIISNGPVSITGNIGIIQSGISFCILTGAFKKPGK